MELLRIAKDKRALKFAKKRVSVVYFSLALLPKKFHTGKHFLLVALCVIGTARAFVCLSEPCFKISKDKLIQASAHPTGEFDY